MKPIHIIYIIFFILFSILVITNVILFNVSLNLNNQITLLKKEKNYFQQDLEKARLEIIEKEKILIRQNELLDKVKNAKTYKDYLNIWKELAK